jgi:WD40 repeat protein
VHTLPGGELLRAIDIPERWLARVAWDELGTVVAAVDDAARPHAWRESQALELPPLSGITSVAVDPRGRWIAFGDEVESPAQPTVRVFSAHTGEELATLRMQACLPFGGAVRRVAFDPTGEYLVATSGDYGTVQAWRATASGWAVSWVHDYGGGNPSELMLAVDARSERVWVWGMMPDTPAAFELATGRQLTSLARSGLTDFGPAADGRTVAALRTGELVLLEPDGRERFGDVR